MSNFSYTQIPPFFKIFGACTVEIAISIVADDFASCFLYCDLRDIRHPQVVDYLKRSSSNATIGFFVHFSGEVQIGSNGTLNYNGLDYQFVLGA